MSVKKVASDISEIIWGGIAWGAICYVVLDQAIILFARYYG